MFIVVIIWHDIAYIAAIFKVFIVFLFLLQKGIDVNAELLNGRNSLHYAADYGHVDVLNYLISKGGKVDVSVGRDTVGLWQSDIVQK